MIGWESRIGASLAMRGRMMTILGIGSDAQLELLETNYASWRSSLAGAALMNLILAWVFKLLSPASSLWLWASLGWISYAGIAIACQIHELVPSSRGVTVTWLVTALLMSLAVGILWSSLAWWLPPTPAIQLLAALASVMVALGSASASVSVGTLFAVCLPMLVIVPSAMFWHAQLPVAAAVIFGLQSLIWRHGLTLHRNMLATINQRRQVEDLSEQLRLKQTLLQQAERERGIMGERQRLLRDMHDGVGASLVSALKMIEHGRMDLADTARVLRECLDDLRLAVDSMECIDEDLVALLATLRYRFGDRIERAGIVCEWDIRDVPALPWLHASQALDVLRILQEALANVLKHSQASRVRINVQLEEVVGAPAVVALRIQDSGVGFNQSATIAGRGLRHMQQRASEIGGRVELDSIPGGGTRLCLLLPLCRQDPAGACPVEMRT